MSELLPCPFCGGRNFTFEGAPDERGDEEHGTKFAYAVYCTANNGDCGVGPSARSEDEASIAWNRRAALVREAVRNEALEADAARYRFVRKIGHGTYLTANFYGERLDEEIDVALKREPNKVVQAHAEEQGNLRPGHIEREPNAAVAVGPTCPANICLTPKGCALYGCKLESAKTGASDE